MRCSHLALRQVPEEHDLPHECQLPREGDRMLDAHGNGTKLLQGTHEALREHGDLAALSAVSRLPRRDIGRWRTTSSPSASVKVSSSTQSPRVSVVCSPVITTPSRTMAKRSSAGRRAPASEVRLQRRKKTHDPGQCVKGGWQQGQHTVGFLTSSQPLHSGTGNTHFDMDSTQVWHLTPRA